MASAADRDGAGCADHGDSNSNMECPEADLGGRADLSPVRGFSLVEAGRSCTWSHGLLARTITQKRRTQ